MLAGDRNRKAPKYQVRSLGVGSASESLLRCFITVKCNGPLATIIIDGIEVVLQLQLYGVNMAGCVTAV